MLIPQLFIMLSYDDRIHYSAAAFILSYIPLIFMLTKSIYNNQLENIRIQESLQDSVDKLHTLSITDSLTHTYTRRYFFDIAKNQINVSLRDTSTLSLLMIDIDHFKKVNDNYGHQAGDIILTSLAKELQYLIRKSDTLARLGGEEFAILLPNTSNNDAVNIAQKIRKYIEKKVFIYEKIKILITVSIGTSELNKNCTSIESLYKEADNNLYVAKHNGRNRVN